MRQLRWVLVLVCAAGSIAAAADTYLGDAIKTRVVTQCRFVPLRGGEGWR